jgi:hypothetical protein
MEKTFYARATWPFFFFLVGILLQGASDLVSWQMFTRFPDMVSSEEFTSALPGVMTYFF